MRGAAANLLGRGSLMRAVFEALAPAAVGHVVAAGSNKRLLPTAFPCCWVLPSGNRGFASILRLPLAVASCHVLRFLLRPRQKRGR